MSVACTPIETCKGRFRGDTPAAATDLDNASWVFSNVRDGLEGVVGVHASCADSSIARSRLSVGVCGGAGADDAAVVVSDVRGLALSRRGVDGVIGTAGVEGVCDLATAAAAAARRSLSGYSQKYRNSRHLTLEYIP